MRACSSWEAALRTSGWLEMSPPSLPERLARRLSALASAAAMLSFAVRAPVTASSYWDWDEMPSATSDRSEEHTSELQSLMRNSYAGFCMKKTTLQPHTTTTTQ